MNILLIGYGKMGKTIESLAVKKGHRIAGIIDIHNQEEIKHIEADVAIEFSRPEAAYENVKRCIERKLPVVCGTTGWLEQKKEIEALCEQQQGTFFYASNFSVGVNIFFKVNAHLAKLMNGFPGYNVIVDEIHHTQKKDAPSGTAITIAEDILKNLQRKNSWINKSEENDEQLSIVSHRIDPAPGTHSVKYTSVIDDIEIKHTAHTREGFALGAIEVATWIVQEKKQGLLNMDDFLKL
ncbi:4-hydroxy-tetrahydrodipicolinate reductase [Chryseotalea sanaruensis]|uniref:4-hydroxy-tetrahydrodipicolinate reductase n=1 Tax=Chryseotalea sanaruensis TaxID=2482724 RepID=A0A401U5Q4_9BACT|nr:4-hydroxy-tetrahydrodipicolinate reductase [Chryseotalea sanaruensis]GCC50202.1 4-hydroxy-tetrahydrodipicolinate reductase [Chryseotalea sanaruensis]